MNTAEIKNEIANAVQSIQLIDQHAVAFTELYPAEKYSVECDKELSSFFAICHGLILKYYSAYNRRGYLTISAILTINETKLLECINTIFDLQNTLANSSHAFRIDSYYEDIFKKTLRHFNGESNLQLPKKIKVPLYIPIFFIEDIILSTHNINSSYSILSPIGSGSFATVYKFHDSFLNKELALKVANEDLDEKELERFALEYETLARLNSPNIVEVYNYDKELHRYTMEYLPYSLSSYYKQTSITPEKRIEIAKQVCSAVHYLISKGLFHRDLSPNNVLIKEYDDGTIVAKLSDFGLVKTPDFKKTTYLSDPKGTYVPREVLFRQVPFKDFGSLQELSSLTDLLFYIMNGFDYDENEDANNVYINAYKAGTNVDLNQRIDNVPELLQLFLAASSRVSH